MIYIFGHRNPDTDSIASSIALSELKQLQGFQTEAFALGPLSRETAFVLKRFGLEPPRILEDIKNEVRDLNHDEVVPVAPDSSILQAFQRMEQEKIKTLPVCDESRKLLGILTMKDIAMALITEDERRLSTHTDNLLSDLKGKFLVGDPQPVEGRVMVMAFFHKTLEKNTHLDKGWITIVGDNYDNIDYCIRSEVGLIIITGNHEIPRNLMDQAREKGIPVISVAYDTYLTSKRILQCNHIKDIMRRDNLHLMRPYELLEEVHLRVRDHRHSFYPIVDEKDRYIGLVGRNRLLSPAKKQVILVDHNEFSQSAPGIEEAEILEVVDHHRIGDLRTRDPISFRNMPVGSTCTILEQMYREAGITPSKAMASVMISGILSDTLYFRSPTTTETDRLALGALNRIAGLDLDGFARELFTEGTSLEGLSTREIFYRDYKTFELGRETMGISQIFTLDMEGVMSRREDIMALIRKTKEEDGHHTVLIMITDILKEGSTLFYETRREKMITLAFGFRAEQGIFLSGIVSRKKQMVPALIDGYHQTLSS